ncbi:unnamed protein product [Phytophthora lilii]|uniref:Unnamed protein product n=1 Tax=Phytophthora lilii TaxID=2077276 RepID=A0A9W7CRF2_9STRA|nr:unnamed protein product [Phytophthora lilii]
MSPHLLYASVARDYDGYVLSFDGSAKTEKHGGHGSCSWILWRLPTWDIVIAASAHLSSTTVNIAEYTGMNNGVKAALNHGVTNLIIVGDTRLAIQQSMGVIACRKETLQVQLMRHKELTTNLNSGYRSIREPSDQDCAQRNKETELKTLNRIPEVLYADEQALADVDLNSQTTARCRRAEPINKGLVDEQPQVMALTRSQARRVRFAEPVTTDVPQRGVVSDVRRHCTPEGKDRRNDDQNIESANEESDDNSEAGTLPVVDGPKLAEREAVRQQPNPVDVQAERLRRIRVAQDEERRWADLKANLRGDIESLSFKRAASASKLADRYVIDKEDLLQYVGKGRKMGDSDEAETRLRLVVPTTMIDEVMQSCHD